MIRNFFELGDPELATGAANFNTLISASSGAATYGLLAGDVASFTAANAAFQTAYAAAINPATRTSASISTKDAARAILRRTARNVALKINGTPSVTDAQKITLGLKPRAVPQPIQPLTVKPALLVKSVNGNLVEMIVRQPDASKRGKPPGAYGVQIMSFVGEQPSNDLSLWRVEGNTTTNKLTVAFPTTLPAFTRVWLCAGWITPRLQCGPACTPVAVNLGTFIVQNVDENGVMKIAA